MRERSVLLPSTILPGAGDVEAPDDKCASAVPLAPRPSKEGSQYCLRDLAGDALGEQTSGVGTLKNDVQREVRQLDLELVFGLFAYRKGGSKLVAVGLAPRSNVLVGVLQPGR